MARSDEDTYARGWAEGVRASRFQVLQSEDLRDAVDRLEDMLIDDYRQRRQHAAMNRRRKGLA